MPARFGSDTLDPADSDAPAWSKASGPRYTLKRRIAGGGGGDIWEADDHQLGREVAIKVLPEGSAYHRARFERESRIAARLQHPAIVPVHETGTLPDGRVFYAMKLVRGRTLAEELALRPSLAERLALLPHLVAVAEAVAYAHSQGVIHRDIKPQNILVGPFGETVLIDWGVAREEGHPDELDMGREVAPGLTQVGAIIGTPAYMAPEQARGEVAEPTVDVWALGATLHQLLTGRPPFPLEAPDTIEALRAGRTPEPLGPEVPADLVAITRHAMAPEPRDRYPDGEALAQDLRRFVSGQLVSTRRYTRGELVARWVRANRALVAVAGVATLVVIIVSVASVWRVILERNQAVSARTLAEARADALILTQARRALTQDPTDAVGWLLRYPDDGADPEEAFEVAQLAMVGGVARMARASDDACSALWFLADDTLLVAGSGDGRIDATTGALVPGQVREGFEVPEGDGWVVAQASTGTIRRGRAGEPERVVGELGTEIGALEATDVTLAATRSGEVWRLSEPPVRLDAASARLVAFDGRGARWAIRRRDGSVRTGTVDGVAVDVGTVQGEGPIVVTDEGAVVGSDDGTVRALPGGSVLFRRDAAIVALELDAARGRLAVADADGGLVVVGLGDGAVAELPYPGARVAGLAFSPEGLLAATRRDDTFVLWDVDRGAVWSRRGQAGIDAAPAFSGDGRRVATCSTRGTTRVWDVPGGERTDRGHEGQAAHVVFVGEYVVTDGMDGVLRVLDPHGARSLRLHTDFVYGLEVSPEGNRLLSAGLDGLAAIWDVVTGSAIPLRGHQGRVRRARWLDDGRVVTAGNDGTLRVWSSDGQPLAEVQAHDGPATFGLSWDGSHLLSNGADRRLVRWDLQGPPETLVTSFGDPDTAYEPVALADGRMVVVEGPRSLLVVDGVRLEHVVMPADLDAADVRVSLAGDAVAFAGREALWVWWADGRWQRLGRLTSESHGLAWSPDGRLIATGSLDGTVRVRRLGDGAAAVVHVLEGGALDVAFSPDGTRLAATGIEGATWVGPVREEDLVPSDPAKRREWLAARTTWRVADVTP